MAIEHVDRLATDKLKAWMEELYNVCLELVVLTKMWEEISVGARNPNDAWCLDSLTNRLRELRRERAALHKLIHEEPERKAAVETS